MTATTPHTLGLMPTARCKPTWWALSPGLMKHVERRHFYLRELVEDHVIRVPFVATVDNIADFFTKPLKSKDFFRMAHA